MSDKPGRALRIVWAIFAAGFGLAAPAGADTFDDFEDGAVDGYYEANGENGHYQISTAYNHSPGGMYCMEYVVTAGQSGYDYAVQYDYPITIGDVIRASFWTYNLEAGGSPRLRIWGHWSDEQGRNLGSAGGNATYSGQTVGWEELSWQWDSSGAPSGTAYFTLEIRGYGLGTTWVDDISVRRVAGPFARPGEAATTVNTPVQVVLEGDDSVEPGPEALCYRITSLPSHGELIDEGNAHIIQQDELPYELVDGGRIVRYTPATDYTGLDAFAFCTYDGQAGSEPAIVQLVVQDVSVIITEIMYNPHNVSDNDWEWIEIYNAGDVAIELKTLTDDDGEPDHEGNLLGGLIGLGQIRIIAKADNPSRTQQEFLNEWGLDDGQVIFVSGSSWEALANDGDLVRLIDTADGLLDQVAYEDDGLVWPADDGAASIYLTDGHIDVLANDQGASWALASVGVDGAWASPGGDVGSPGYVPGVTECGPPGDFDCDGDVDADDLTAFLGCHEGPTGQPQGRCVWCDFDRDADVDLVDFATLQANYGSR